MMKALLIYTIPLGMMIYLSLPAVLSDPLTVLPRLVVYFSLPAAVFLGIVVILFEHLVSRWWGVSTGMRKSVAGSPILERELRN